MPVLEVPYSEDLLVASGQDRQQLEVELRFLLASKLFYIHPVLVEAVLRDVGEL